jgi:excisionase family DNA binding protein
VRMTLTIDISDVVVDGRALDIARAVASVLGRPLESAATTRTVSEDDTAVFVSIPEAAKRLGVGRSFVYQMVAREELPTRRFGRRRVVPVAALHRLADTS